MIKTPAVLVGQAIGDALGMPFESFRDEIHPLLDTWNGLYREGTWHKLPAGHFTDDTEMAIALAESLLRKNAFDPQDIARSYLAWAQTTPHGMGGTTRKAMDALAEGKSYLESGIEFGPEDGHKVGAGTAMRIAPVGIFPHFDLETIATHAVTDARITHKHEEACVASTAIAFAVRRAWEGVQGAALLRETLGFLAWMPMVKYTDTHVFERIRIALSEHSFPSPQALDNLGRRGNAIQITSSALYLAALYTNDFERAVEAAVRGGGDTDTRAAIVGAIVGAHVGLEGIPKKYLNGLHERDRLIDLDHQLFKQTKT